MTVEFTWPTTVRPSSCKFTITTQSIVSNSPLRKSRRVFGTIVDQWTVELTFERLPPEVWMPLSGLLSTLDGPAGILRMWEPARYLPYGMAAGLNMETAPALGIGAPFSDGTYFTDGTGWLDVSSYAAVRDAQPIGSKFVTLTGLVASQATSLIAGDLMEIQGYLYQVARTVASDAAGETLCEIRPRLRTALLPGDPVKFDFPSSPFQLTSDDQTGADMSAPMFGSLGLKLFEVLP